MGHEMAEMTKATNVCLIVGIIHTNNDTATFELNKKLSVV